MVQHGKTERWWNNPNLKKISKRIKNFAQKWNENPFWFKHELKKIRVNLHRQFRHMNKQNLKKGLDYEKESRTNGWETY